MIFDLATVAFFLVVALLYSLAECLWKNVLTQMFKDCQKHETKRRNDARTR